MWNALWYKSGITRTVRYPVQVVVTKAGTTEVVVEKPVTEVSITKAATVEVLRIVGSD